jgi:hypothetical protein
MVANAFQIVVRKAGGLIGANVNKPFEVRANLLGWILGPVGTSLQEELSNVFKQ